MAWRFVALVISSFLLEFNTIESKSYRAAVVDFNAHWSDGLSQDANVEVNVQSFLDYVRKAAQQQAQIVVFPENGLAQSNEVFFGLPDPSLKVVIADDSSYSEVLRKISAEARNKSIYVVINVFESFQENGTSWKYNTDVVFDSRGALIARYRKYNLFSEDVNQTTQPEHVMFTTDFGVTFGLFTCFDILFGEPSELMFSKYGVRDFILPTHWFSEMPFLLAIQEQFAWSYGHDVNLLASAYKNVSTGSAGSGIYRGRLADPLYTMNSWENSTLLVGDVPMREDSNASYVDVTSNDYIESISGLTAPFLLKREPKFESYEAGPVFTPVDFNSTELCKGDLCCTINVTFTRRTSPQSDNINVGPFKYHRPVISNGVRVFPPTEQVGGVQICGVIGCLTKDIASCSLGKNNLTEYAGVDSVFDHSEIHFNSPSDEDADDWIISEIKISGNFLNEDSIITPNACLASNISTNVGELPKLRDLDLRMTPSESSGKSLVEFALRSDVEVLNCGIYSRVLSRDTKSAAIASSLATPFCSIIIPLLLLLNKI